MTGTSQYKEFNKECQITSVESEYGEFVGKEKYIIFSDLEEKELEHVYGRILDDYRPYILLSLDCQAVFADYHRNNTKFRMRGLRREHALDREEYELYFNQKIAAEVLMDTTFGAVYYKEIQELVRKTADTFTEPERERIIDYFLKEESISKIAARQNVLYNTVRRTVIRAQKLIQNQLER